MNYVSVYLIAVNNWGFGDLKDQIWSIILHFFTPVTRRCLM